MATCSEVPLSSPQMAQEQAGLSVYIVEDHNEVLEYIYNDIGNKRLPFNGISLVHFDSHPDLLCPEDLPADLVYDKATLFQQISIGDWILPAVYAGHFDSIIWLKPFWADQLCDGHYSLLVGKNTDNHQIRVNLPIPYYLSEGFHSAMNKLENIQIIPLIVITMEFSPTDKQQCCPHWYEQVKDLLMKSKGWILDIDLDFYSTVNPFKDWFTEEQYMYLFELYKLDLPIDSSRYTLTEKDAISVNESRIAQLSSLSQYWAHPPPSNTSLIELEIRDLIGQERDEEIVKPDDIHLAGMMTDLPHHISTEEEIDLLLKETKQLLAELRKASLLPNIVTIARSSSDPYTPPHQVNKVQTAVLDTISQTCQLKLITHEHYLQKTVAECC